VTFDIIDLAERTAGETGDARATVKREALSLKHSNADARSLRPEAGSPRPELWPVAYDL
jgi:hypothetical protein